MIQKYFLLLLIFFHSMAMRKTDDKLKGLLRGDAFLKAPIEEINMLEHISPVANIKVV